MSAVDVAEALWLLLAALALNFSVGLAGQPMLGQGAFVAIGGYGTVLLADRADLPLGVAAAAAVLGSGLVGWCVSYGSSRLRGAHLALATWALAWLVFATITALPGTFGGSQGVVREAPARLVSQWLGITLVLTPVWHVALAGALCAAVLVATRSLLRGPLGLDLAALRIGPAAAESLGLPAAALRRSALAASAALGALAGAGTAVLLGLVAPSDVSPLLSVQLYVAVLVGGAASVWGPVAGVALLLALPSVADAVASSADIAGERSRGVVTAALLVLVLVLREPLARRLRRRVQSSGAEGSRDDVALPAAPAATVDPAAPVVLSARDLHHRYDGLTVLDGVDLDLRAGEVHALVGPNGSGKTTLLRLLAGAMPVQSGAVMVTGRDCTSADQRGRVLAGVVRTFQHTALFPCLSVADQLRAGARVTECAGVGWRAALRTPSWQRSAAASAAAVADLLGRSGLSRQGETLAQDLNHGDQRLLQVARAAATGPSALLLDEPAAGMSGDESRRLRALISDLRGNGVAVLLVEHDMRFVAAVADRMTVLADGRVLASGSPDDVRRLPAVRAAYLGQTAGGAG